MNPADLRRGTGRHRFTRAAGSTTAALTVVAVLGGCSAGAPAAAPTTVTVVATAPTATSAAPATPAPATSSPSDSSTSSPTLDPPNCPTSSLAPGITNRRGAAGSVTEDLVLTNTGSERCQLRGFPGVSFVAGDDGHQVGSPAVETDDPREEVDLAPGDAAHAALRLPNVGLADDAACAATEIRGLRIYPPGDTEAAFVAAPGRACSATGPGVPTSFVQPVRPGA